MSNKLVLMNAILVLAHAVESVLGFGATITAFGLGVYLFPVNTLVVILVMIALLQSAWLVIRWFKHIEWNKIFSKILPVSLIGVIIGIVLRNRFDESVLKLILGLFIICLSLFELSLVVISRKKEIKNIPEPAGFFLILSGGIFHGLLAVGAPLIVYYASRQLSSQGSVKGTLSFVWLLLNIVMLGGFIINGQITTDVLKLTGMLIPGLAAGILAGSLIRVSDNIFRIVTYILLMIIGSTLVVQYF
jgi:uncharacterized membrane protein YfcA